MQYCKFATCAAPVKPGRNCMRCGAPVCHTHRREFGGGLFSLSQKRIVCNPHCGGPPDTHQQSLPGDGDGAFTTATPAANGGGTPPNAAHSASAFMHDGQRPNPTHTTYHHAPPAPRPGSSNSPESAPPGGGSGGSDGAAEASGVASPSYAEAMHDVPCAGGPLPSLPVPDADNIVHVVVEGRCVAVSVDLRGITGFMAANGVTSGRFRQGECVQYVLSGAAQSSVATLRQRAVLLGVTTGDSVGGEGGGGGDATAPRLVVFERIRPPGGGYSHNAALVPSFAVPTLSPLTLGRCRHCGCLLPMDEAKYHVELHHKQGGTTTRVDEKLGTCCGNVDLMTSLLKVRKLGEGAQGEVWLSSQPPPKDGAAAQDAEQYVVKVVKCETPAEANKRYQQSVRLMNLTNAHVVKYLAVQLPPAGTLVRVVMPFYPEGDLAKLIRQVQRMKEGFLCSILLQLAQALEFLHSHSPPIIHGDIKPENIMLFNNRTQVIMMDFDTAIEVTTSSRLVRSETGTMHWQAPEACNAGQANLKTDTWSLGLVVFCMAVLPEFPMVTNGKQELKLLNDPEWASAELQAIVLKMVVAAKFSRAMAQLVSDMLAHDLAVRPAASDVVERVTEIMTDRLLRGLD